MFVCLCVCVCDCPPLCRGMPQNWAEGLKTWKKRCRFGGLWPQPRPRLCWPKAYINRVTYTLICAGVTFNFT